MNIAVFGGRFDPPHNGHIRIAKTLLKIRPDIDAIWLMPANTHPWKPMVASPADRLAMVKFLEEDKIKVSDRDIKRGGETYTIDTVRELIKYRGNKYFWVCGIDQIKDFCRWKEYDELQNLIDFLVFPRPGFDAKTNLPAKFNLVQGN